LLNISGVDKGKVSFYLLIRPKFNPLFGNNYAVAEYLFLRQITFINIGMFKAVVDN